VIQPLAKPFKDKAGIAVLRGNLAPRGAVIKPSAATPELMVHKGRAVVFEDIEDFHKRIDDENLDIDETCVMVLKNCGPKGYPGMAEVGNMPLPPKVLRKGITDMVRISDARMSGTAYGTVVLHTAPEAAAGGPLAIVRNGDIIELDVPNRKIQLHISDEELQQRLKAWTPPKPPMESGYWKLYIDHVLQADEGVDLDFLVGKRGSFVPRDKPLKTKRRSFGILHGITLRRADIRSHVRCHRPRRRHGRVQPDHARATQLPARLRRRHQQCGDRRGAGRRAHGLPVARR
jgi:L-arabonate dehydrase